PFATELAKVTLMLAKELEITEARKFSESEDLFIEEKALPLENLDANILCADALFTPWPAADAIIGNPPYLGSRYLAKEHGYDYANKLYARFPGVPKMADFCTHWFRLAHDALAPCTAQNPCSGRAGLVGTNTIRQNESREASLGYIVENGGVITDSVSTQVWSGEAAVHVSIVNWKSGVSPDMADGRPARPAAEGQAGSPSAVTGGTPVFRLTFQRGDSVDSPWDTYELPHINTSLSVGTDVTGARVLVANEKAKKCFTGQNPVNAGFFLTPDEAHDMIRADARNREVIWPYMIGRDLVEDYGPTRWIIDFAKRDQFAARSYALPWARVQERVMPVVLAKAEAEKKAQGKEVTRYTRIAQRWWQFYDYRPGTIAAINSAPRYIACARVGKRPIFEFVNRDVHADSALVIFGLADDYSFGILQSGLHFDWFKARCSTLKGDFRYTSDTVFDTFPWPQSPTRGQIAGVAAAAVALRALRREVMAAHGWSLRDLYRTLDEPGDNPLRTAQARLDTAVRTTYGFSPKADPLAFLLALNLTLAAKEKAGEKITPPGIPLPEAERAAFITDDCIRIAAPPADED
ncbi:MAG: type IIL restriction-modification enzyme MmeI, partial [Chthoniobacteraceae bacterium]